MMNLKKYYYYYLAINRGEIFEKFKIKFLKNINHYKLDNSKHNNYKFKKILNTKEIHSLPKLEELDIFEKKYKLKELVTQIQILSVKNHWRYENLDKYKDVKYEWEINRLQYLLNLELSGDSKKAKIILDLWIKNNAYNSGINWYSNLEVGIRSLNLLFYNIICKEEKKSDLENLIYLHYLHLSEDISSTEKCIPNNHLIGEASALYMLSFFLESSKVNLWRKKSKEILKNYIKHFRKDGTYQEASLSYHRFTLQMYIVVYIASKKFNDNFLEKEILEILKNSYTFFNSIKKPDGNFPDFGDNDNGYFYQIKYQESFSEFVESLDNFLRGKDYDGDIQRLFNIFDLPIDAALKKRKIDKVNFFKEGKFYVLKNQENYIFFNNQDQIFHTHSDGLSIDLMLRGKQILIDSGTYSYNKSSSIRNQYRGTRCHNTVWFGNNQTKEIGNFRWVKKAKNNLVILNDKENIVKGNIVTYKKQRHERLVEVKNGFREIIIKDNINSKNNFFELNWNFAKDIQIDKINKNEYLIKDLGIYIKIYSNEEIEIKTINDTFYSPKYGIEVKRRTLRILGEKNCIITTIFKEGVKND